MNLLLKTEEFSLNPAVELKQSIQSNTIKGFFSTMLLIVVFSLGIIIFPARNSSISKIEFFNPEKTEVMTFGPDLFVQEKDNSNQTEKSHVNTSYTGIEEVSGDINVVSDDTPESEIKEFATIEKISIALSTKGDGIRKNINTIPNEIKPIEKKTIINSKVDEEEFIAAEILPSYNISELQNNLRYPDMARKIGLEGRVVISAIVDENGLIINEKIYNSENEIFNSAALEAVRKTKFSPAVQNGIKIKCPLIIPIVFKLR